MKKILTFGVFDYFHIGHLRLLEHCKECGDYLIVAVQDDNYVLRYKPDAEILYTIEERVHILKSLKIVDNVIVYDSISTKTLQKIDFDILALGEDHIGFRFQAVEDWCKENGKEIIRMKRTPNISSSDIKKRLQNR